MDQEDVLADLQKTVEALKKDHEALVKKERIVDIALNASESEIREFQSHKQQELNKLDTVVALKMHQVSSACERQCVSFHFKFKVTAHLQIECLVNGKLPLSLSNVIVFTRSGSHATSQSHRRA